MIWHVCSSVRGSGRTLRSSFPPLRVANAPRSRRLACGPLGDWSGPLETDFDTQAQWSGSTSGVRPRVTRRAKYRRMGPMRRRKLGVHGDAPRDTRRRSERPGGVAAELSDELARPTRCCIHKVTPTSVCLPRRARRPILDERASDVVALALGGRCSLFALERLPLRSTISRAPRAERTVMVTRPLCGPPALSVRNGAS